MPPPTWSTRRSAKFGNEQMNGILLIDKPPDWTSHDVVAKLRGVLHEKRAGHSGTLDPMATGLLAVFFGRATRAVQFAENDEKEYLAALRLGTVTDTLDITGRIVSSYTPDVALSELDALLPRFIGEQEQLPPMYSAIKVNGAPLYKAARAGREVERKPRKITIFELERVGELSGDLLLRVRCSKGTYIRSLADDIGRALGCGACLSYLRRTRAGAFSVDEAATLESVYDLAARGKAESLLRPVDTLFSALPSLELTENQERVIRNGGSFSTPLADGDYRVYSKSGEFLALGSAADGRMKSVKSFFEV